MSRKVGIVTSQADKWEFQQIKEGVHKQGFELEVISPDLTNIVLDREQTPGYFSILGRVERPILYPGLAILKALESRGEKVFNTSEAIYNSQNKAYTSIMLLKAGIPHPRTLFSFSHETVLEHAAAFKFPVVLKPWIGGRGVGVVKADTIGMLAEYVEILKSTHSPVYLQEFIPNDRDIRVMVIGDKVTGAFYRFADKHSWKTNLSYGGKGQVCAEIDDELANLALKALKAIGAHIGGVDIMKNTDDNSLSVIEINVCPLFRGFYDITGINPGDHMGRLLTKKD